MQKRIKRVGDKYQVQSKGGKNMGEYDTKEGAEKRLRQVEWFKTLKATIETPFMQKYPQHRKEVEDNMKFRNMLQEQAEKVVAQKHNLQHSSMSRNIQGRWIKMLKEAGAVTTSTAGIDTKPLYGKKKKEDEEDDME